MKLNRIFLPISILFIAIFFSCVDDDFIPIDGVCPSVTSTNPDNLVVDVSLSQKYPKLSILRVLKCIF